MDLLSAWRVWNKDGIARELPWKIQPASTFCLSPYANVSVSAKFQVRKEPAKV